jgi:tRNA pseudouridine38-40 synthase
LTSFYTFFNQIDQFKQNHFLWVTAGGMEVAQIVRGVQAEVDKQLGDEDEDPEGGDG